MGLARIDVEMAADKPLLLRVNGQEVAGVVGLAVRHVPPSLPVVTVELAGEVSIEGEGIVQVGQEAGDEIAYLHSFLFNLDPEKVDDAAAELFGTEGPGGKVITTPGQAFLAAIAAMVDGPRR